MPADHVAIGGRLIADRELDLMLIDIAVMDGAWPRDARRRVIENVYQALAAALGVTSAPPGWWINFRVIEEGSWGSRGGVLSILDLLRTGAFTPARVEEIRKALESSPPPD